MPNRIMNILNEYMQGLFQIIGNNLKQIILYGSYARGEQAQNGEISDIDIMILVDLNNEKIKELEDDIISYSYDMDLKYNILLSPIIESINNYEQRKEYIPFYKNIAEEGVLLR